MRVTLFSGQLVLLKLVQSFVDLSRKSCITSSLFLTSIQPNNYDTSSHGPKSLLLNRPFSILSHLMLVFPEYMKNLQIPTVQIVCLFESWFHCHIFKLLVSQHLQQCFTYDNSLTPQMLQFNYRFTLEL